jgi:hypothetical protein
MSTETLVKAPQIKNAKLIALDAKYNFKEAGTGTKFWVTQTSEKVTAQIAVYLSENGKGCYGRVNINGTLRNVNLGISYESIMTLDGLTQDGMVIDCEVAPRIPNPILTDKDIEAVEALPGRSKQTTANIRAARLNPEQASELVMISFEEPEVE